MLKKAYIFLCLILSLSIIHLIIMAQSASIGYKTDKSERQLSDLRSQNRSLAALAAREESPGRIDSIAKNSLGMAVPEEVNYIIVSPEGSPAE